MASDQELTIGQIAARVERRLPAGYSFRWTFWGGGEQHVGLRDEDDDEIDVCRDDLTPVEVIEALVEAAIRDHGEECPECRGSGVFERGPDGVGALDCPACDGKGRIPAGDPEAEPSAGPA